MALVVDVPVTHPFDPYPSTPSPVPRNSFAYVPNYTNYRAEAGDVALIAELKEVWMRGVCIRVNDTCMHNVCM